MEVAGLSLEAVRVAAPTGNGTRPKSSGTAFSEILRRAESEPSKAAYTVRRGDNLTRICRDFLQETGGDASAQNVWQAVRRVSEANGLRNRNLIHPGDQLDLSVLRSGGSETLPAAPPEPEKAVAQAAVQPKFQPLALLANLSTGLEDLLAEAEFEPLVSSLPGASRGITPLDGMGPVSDISELTQFTSAEAELDRALRLMETMVVEEKDRMASLEAQSPWSRILTEPAHLTSEFGVRRDPLTRRWEHHEGIDLAAPQGSEVRAFKSGEVVFSGWRPGYGRTVVVRHEDGLETVYGHNSKNLVNAGARVDENTAVSEVGSTGRSTGPHLHFEVRRNGVAIDPIPFLAPAPAPEIVASAT